MNDISITVVANGFIVKVGCMTFVSQHKEDMFSEIGRYIDNPDTVSKEYQEKRIDNKSSEPDYGGELSGVRANLTGQLQERGF